MARSKKVKAVELEDWVKERDENVRERRYRKPLTERHKAYLEAIETHTVTFVTSPAGTGKTALACSVAARWLKEKKVSRIVLVRPLVECDENTGFLPGDIKEKVGPFVAPMMGWLGEHFHKGELEQMYEQGTLEIMPLAQMRGTTFDDAFVILDEAQLATRRQLKMFLTRIGDSCRMVVCGDVRQSDIVPAGSDLRQVPLLQVVSLLGKSPRSPEIALVVMTRADVLRPDLVAFIDERLDENETLLQPTRQRKAA